MLHFNLLFSVLIDIRLHTYALFLLTCHLDKKSNKHSLIHKFWGFFYRSSPIRTGRIKTTQLRVFFSTRKAQMNVLRLTSQARYNQLYIFFLG